MTNDLISDSYPDGALLTTEEQNFLLSRCLDHFPGKDFPGTHQILNGTEDTEVLDQLTEYWFNKAEVEHKIATEKQSSALFKDARNAFLRASNFYRNAEFFEIADTNRKNELGMKCRETFWAACFLFDIPVEIADIPYNNTPIPGYFLKAHDGTDKEKTLVITGGLNSSAEDLFMIFAPGALKNGYHLLVYDGPGQDGMLRSYPELVFRPDYEYPVKAAIDFILERNDVDMKRLGMIGIGLGAYFALRGTGHDKRIKYMVTNPAINSLLPFLKFYYGSKIIPDVTIENIFDTGNQIMSLAQRLCLYSFMKKFGKHSSTELISDIESYIIDESLIKRISEPMALITDDAMEKGTGSQSLEINRMLTEQADIIKFYNTTKNEPYEILNDHIFSWLNNINS